MRYDHVKLPNSYISKDEKEIKFEKIDLMSTVSFGGGGSGGGGGTRDGGRGGTEDGDEGNEGTDNLAGGMGADDLGSAVGTRLADSAARDVDIAVNNAMRDGVISASEQAAIDAAQDRLDAVQETNEIFGNSAGTSQVAGLGWGPDHLDNHQPSSMRPDGVSGRQRPGFEDNALDAIAQDNIANTTPPSSGAPTSNHQPSSMRPDGGGGYQDAGSEHNALDAIAEDASLNGSPCFVKGTQISTPFGYIAIEKLKIGDKVLAFDPFLDHGRGRLVAKEVTQLFLNTTTEFLTLTWEEDGEKNEVITTPGHHFLREDGCFGPISEMIEDNSVRVILSSGEVRLCEVERITYSAETAGLFEQSQTYGVAGAGALAVEVKDSWECFNFEVGGYHTYVAQGIRVHNDCTATPDSSDIVGNDGRPWWDYGPPVVVDLDGDGIEVESLASSTARFDFDNDGFQERTAWIGADDGLLMYDSGNDNILTEAKEIAFAFFTEDENDSDLEALREVFDSNKDDVLNDQDDEWAFFKIWQDANQNGKTDEGELRSLADLGITEIGVVTREGTSQLFSDGTASKGLIDVIFEDGSVVDGGDVAFAYETNGVREVLDENGNITLEYEGGAPSEYDGSSGFIFQSQEQFAHHLGAMELLGDMLSVLDFARQDGSNVQFRSEGNVLFTVQNTTTAELENFIFEQVTSVNNARLELGLSAQYSISDGIGMNSNENIGLISLFTDVVAEVDSISVVGASAENATEII